MSTNVPLVTWQNGSPVLPSEQAILAGVQADINAAFGGGVNPSLQTPQGQLAMTETAIIGDKNSQIAYISNQVNPSMSSGVWQDAIGEIYYIVRIPASGTVVNCTCVGAVNTIIPIGSIAQDTTGYTYASTATATIPASGSVTVQFQNQTQGPFACNIGTLTTIVTAVAGWNTISNPQAGSIGNYVESRAAFEARRLLSVAGNAINSIQSIFGAVLSVPNVIDAFVIDNPGSSALPYGSTTYSIPAHSVLVSVSGGNSTDIAKAIWNKKPPGCGYITAAGVSGSVAQTVAVVDTSYPPGSQPSYNVTYLIPASKPVYYYVQIKNSPQLPSNIIQLVQDAIIASFYGEDGGTSAGINHTLVSGRYYANVTAISPYVEILEILLGFTAIGATLTSVTLGVDQMPTISASQIAVYLI
jgi:hypothetical protein